MARRRCVECSRFIAKDRNFCDEHAKRCWCPCDCGCQEPHFVVSPSGLCPDCENGNHEVPPEFAHRSRGVEAYLQLHQAIVIRYQAVLRARAGKRYICNCRKADCIHKAYARRYREAPE